jgi:cobalt ECF transporter T component CbiQ
MANRIPPFLLDTSAPGSFKKDMGKVKIPFIEKGINHLAGVIKKGYAQSELSSQNGFFQKMDARVKILFLLFLIIIVSVKKDLLSEIYIWIFVFLLSLLSRLNIVALYKKILFLGLIFGFLIALPSAFNFITRGEIIISVFKLSKSYTFWIYHLPAEIGITREGIYGVLTLTMRVINSLSLSFLVLYTTPFPEILRALKVLRVPDTFLIIIALCYKYIFLFAKIVEDMYLAKKSRTVREVKNHEAREWITERMAFIFRRTQLRCEEVYGAMIGRGFSDRLKLYGFRKMRMADWCVGLSLFLVGVLLLWI